MNHSHPASSYCKKIVLKQYQELIKTRKLKNSDCKNPDPSQPHDGTAPPPPGARHVRSSGAGLGGHPSELPPFPSLPHRGGGWTRITIPLPGSDCRRCRLRSAPAAASPAGPGSPRTHGLTGRHRPPAPPPSRAGSALASRQEQSERTPPEQPHSPKPGRGPGGRQCPPAPGSSSPSESGHAAQPAPNFRSQRTTTSRTPGVPFPAPARRPCPAATPSHPLTKFARRAGGVRGSTWGRQRAKRSPVVLKDAQRAETAGPADSVSSSYSGCRPCPPAALRGRSPLGSATGRCRGSAAPPHGPATTRPRRPAQSLHGATRGSGSAPVQPGRGRSHFLFLRAAARAPRPAPAVQGRGSRASRPLQRHSPKADCSARRPGRKVPHALRSSAPAPAPAQLPRTPPIIPSNWEEWPTLRRLVRPFRGGSISWGVGQRRTISNSTVVNTTGMQMDPAPGEE